MTQCVQNRNTRVTNFVNDIYIETNRPAVHKDVYTPQACGLLYKSILSIGAP